MYDLGWSILEKLGIHELVRYAFEVFVDGGNFLVDPLYLCFEIHVLTQTINERGYPGLSAIKPPFIDDTVTILSADGETRKTISIIKAFWSAVPLSSPSII